MSSRSQIGSLLVSDRQYIMGKCTDLTCKAHSNALIVAGSETSATTLSGLHYYLLNNPDVYTKLRNEVRGAFKSVDEIDAKGAAALPYLTACIDETFRIYPPIPIAMPRVTPKGGCTIAGHYVPGDVSSGGSVSRLNGRVLTSRADCGWCSSVVGDT